jgi:hypothetical protein
MVSEAQVAYLRIVRLVLQISELLALLIEIRTEPARREEPWPRRATREDTRRI